MSHQAYIYAIYKQLQIYYRHKGRVVWWVWGLRWGGREEKERERKRESEREHLREHL